ncbi:MAG: ABC transporter permease [Sphingobacterium sp.]
MIRSYLKIAVRNLKKNKSFTAINIVGLAIGMAAAMLIMLWVKSEFTYDRFYSKTDQLYAVGNKAKWGGELAVWFYTPKPMAPAIATEYPEVKNVSRFNAVTTFLLTFDDKKLTSQRGAFVDSSFLDMFDFNVLAGDGNRALGHPTQIILTETLAHTIFGDENPIGQTVKIDSADVFTVGAVLEDIPDHSFMKKTTYLLPWRYMEKLGWSDDYWGNNSVQTYIEMDPLTNMDQFRKSFQGFLKRHTDTQIENIIQPIGEQWLYSEFNRGEPTTSRIGMVHTFIAIACFILIIACINFMNLSTAQSEKRAKEVGVRKVVGANKRLLIWQFLTESVLIAIISGLLALLLVALSLPAFSMLIDRQLTLDFGNFYFWSIFIGFVLLTGILAGSYPAFYLSSFIPVKVLKGKQLKISGGVSPRKILVISQFSIAIILIISTIVLRKQIQFAQDREVGYDKNRLINIIDQGDIYKNRALIKNTLVQQGIASHVSRTSSPLTENWSSSSLAWEGKSADDNTLFIRIAVDDGLVATAGLQLLAGRDFDLTKFPTDSTAVIINESAAKALNFKDPLGKQIGDSGIQWHIIGIVKDFIQESPYNPINPLVIQGVANGTSTTNIKLNENISTGDALAKIEKIFKEYNPDYPFEYKFVDEAYAAKFKETQQLGKLSSLFAFLTIFISCLGLFGLAAYMAENRTKEIGVRKVLGASVVSITRMLSKEFILMVCVSCLIAFPAAYGVMDSILNNYAYRITIGWDIFLISGAIALLITPVG